jgi:molecular chaperone HtpG
MERQELIDNLGTVARSGTRAFVARLAEAKDGGGLIGQFGVGFYSAFMVADRIEVVSRRAGSNETWVWRSSGGDGFEISPASPEQAERVQRGTEITLHLKEDAKKYLESYDLQRIIKTYSNHIQFPIELFDDKGEAKQVNTASAVWHRPKSELKSEDYKEAYRSVVGSFDEPLMTLHYKAEGRSSYAVLLFVPSNPLIGMYDEEYRKGKVKLYVRRVFITDDAELLPPYLRFMRGLVDSEDMPLNISREMLQNNPQVAQIRKALTTRVLSELTELAGKDADAFGKIWAAFGKVIKEGIYEDYERREQLLALSRFMTTKGEGPRSLEQYVADMKPNQTEIYYLIGDNIERLRSNPKLEATRARGIEVLMLTEPVDALWTSQPHDFKGKPLKSLSQGEIDLSLVPTTEEPAVTEPKAEAADDEAVIAAVKGELGDRVSDVRASQRLTDSAACLVAKSGTNDRELERLLAKQNRAFGAKPILELNMKHAMVRALSRAKTDQRQADVADLAALLFEQAKILDGEIPDDPAAFATRLNRLIVRGLQ